MPGPIRGIAAAYTAAERSPVYCLDGRMRRLRA